MAKVAPAGPVIIHKARALCVIITPEEHMNIFKALSEGNGRISETNITSFMNYLLDSANELNNSFFVLFAKLIDSQIENNKICDLLDINEKSIREQIINISDSYTVSSEPEYSIKNLDGRKQIPDILLRISSKRTEEDIAFIIIENKISRSAIKKGQIEKQYEYFTKSEDYDESKSVYSILITPDEKIYEQFYRPAIEKNIRAIWLKWVNHSDNENSIESILRNLIKHEQNSDIEPIDPNTQFIIKSFVHYLATEFSKKENGKKNYSYKGFDVVGMVQVSVGKIDYTIKRFSNNMVRLFDQDDNLLEIEVKPVLREINTIYKLDIELFHSTGKAKNTQILGREIINKLKNNFAQ